MSESAPSFSVIQSFVRHEGTEDFFLVSTIDRESSIAMIPAPRYYETLVWKWLPRHGRRDGDQILGQFEAPQGSLGVHLGVCQKLFSGGIGALSDEV